MTRWREEETEMFFLTVVTSVWWNQTQSWNVSSLQLYEPSPNLKITPNQTFSHNSDQHMTPTSQCRCQCPVWTGRSFFSGFLADWVRRIALIGSSGEWTSAQKEKQTKEGNAPRGCRCSIHDFTCEMCSFSSFLSSDFLQAPHETFYQTYFWLKVIISRWVVTKKSCSIILIFSLSSKAN